MSTGWRVRQGPEDPGHLPGREPLNDLKQPPQIRTRVGDTLLAVPSMQNFPALGTNQTVQTHMDMTHSGIAVGLMEVHLGVVSFLLCSFSSLRPQCLS